MRYNVTYSIRHEDGRTETFKAKVFFKHNPNDYGNGYYMSIESPEEPFGRIGYDIRYDHSFRSDKMILYIVNYLSDRYSEKWKLVGVAVEEAKQQ